MKCLNCGQTSNFYLCNNCNINEIIEKTLENIFYYNSNKCDNLIIKEFITSIENDIDKKNCILKLLENYNSIKKDYYYFKCLKITKDNSYEDTVSNYLNNKNIFNKEEQLILLDLLSFYLRDDFVKPEKWCEKIIEHDNLFIELYYISAEYYSMIGEYDKCKYLLNKMEEKLNNSNAIFSNEYNNYDNFSIKIEKLRNLLDKQKNGKPYWPSTEERRLKIAKIYDQKGITYGNIVSLKKQKISEEDFEQIKECNNYNIDTYCSFWCNYIESQRNIKDIYQICAIKVIDNKNVDKFEKYIKPWDGKNYIEKASKISGISLDVFENSDQVNKVISEFKSFVDNNILISTDALGNQLNALIRAYRWSGFNKIENEFLELLDYAAFINEEFDMKNNTREYLLNYFKLEDLKDSYSKAYNNIIIFNKLKELEK